MKTQFWIEQGLLPYLLKDVPHTIIEKSQTGLRIEMEVNGLNMINLIFCAKAFGMGMAINELTQKIQEAA